MNIISKTILLSCILLACNDSKKITDPNLQYQKSTLEALGNFDKEGHRGCRGLMPENTIPAILHALDLAVTTLEMDIVFTKDGKAILSHEPFFNHEITTKPDGTYIDEKDERKFNIYKMDYAEVQTYDVGMKPHPRFPGQEKMKATKPLLSDVFAAVKKDMMTRRRPFPFFNIETKTTDSTDGIYHPKPAEFVDMLMKVISENHMEDHVIIQSFDIRTLKYLHEKYPYMLTSLLVEETEGDIIFDKRAALGFMPNIISPHYSLVTKEFLYGWQSHKVKVIPWTVNDKKEIDRLRALGVDGIITDYPNLLND